METWAGGVAEIPGELPGQLAVPPRSLVSRSEIGVAGILVGVLAILGVLIGLLWSVVSPHVGVVITADGPNVQPNGGDEFFAAEGVFGLIGIVAGVLTGLAWWHGARRWRGPILLVGLVAGGLAGSLVAWQVGRHLGLAHYRELLRSPEAGREFSKPVDVRSMGMLLVQPLAAALTYVWLACWTVRPDLESG